MQRYTTAVGFGLTGSRDNAVYKEHKEAHGSRTERISIGIDGEEHVYTFSRGENNGKGKSAESRNLLCS